LPVQNDVAVEARRKPCTADAAVYFINKCFLIRRFEFES
jgi:hypothetical protein